MPALRKILEFRISVWISPPLYLITVGICINKGTNRLDQIVLQYAHDEWRSVTSPGLSITGLSNLTYKSAGGFAGRNATAYTTIY